jgi:glycosyltransferase involved in cell wall biosynthesis
VGVWITWERHRRSRELAAALGTDLFELTSDLPWAFRAIVLSTRTIWTLVVNRPRRVVVQNPSMVLAGVACCLRVILGFQLIVDRHSNFYEHTFAYRSLKYRGYHLLSRWTVRAADLTIVTNEELKSLVETWKGRGFVLPDKLPLLSLAGVRPLRGVFSVVFVCSHAFDEPIAEVIEAAELLGPEVHIYITGRVGKATEPLTRGAPANVTFTGFLTEIEYQTLLRSCHTVISLTKMPNTLLCSAYEAVALGRPLVISDQPVLTAYFRRGTVATNHEPTALCDAVRFARAHHERLRGEIASLAVELRRDWAVRFEKLRQEVGIAGVGTNSDSSIAATD